MTDITPKRKPEAWRSYIVRTKPWPDIIAYFQKDAPHCDPMLRLVASLAASPASSQLFAATSMSDLLISDTEDFRIGDSTLRVSYNAIDRKFEFRHRTFSGHNDHTTCPESEALQMLYLFLKLKYGVLYNPMA